MYLNEFQINIRYQLDSRWHDDTLTLKLVKIRETNLTDLSNLKDIKCYIFGIIKIEIFKVMEISSEQSLLKSVYLNKYLIPSKTRDSGSSPVDLTEMLVVINSCMLKGSCIFLFILYLKLKYFLFFFQKMLCCLICEEKGVCVVML